MHQMFGDLWVKQHKLAAWASGSSLVLVQTSSSPGTGDSLL